MLIVIGLDVRIDQLSKANLQPPKTNRKLASAVYQPPIADRNR